MKDLKLLLYFLIFVVLLGAGFYAGFKFNSKEKIEYINDTITVTNIDTFKIVNWRPYKVVEDTTIIDTLYSVDSIPVIVEVPISKYNYYDTLIQGQDSAFISEVVTGYRVNIDSLKMRLKITNTVIIPTPIIPKTKRFTIGPQFGIGYNGKIEPYIGIGITYNLFSF